MLNIPTLQELATRIESDILARVTLYTGILRRSFLRVMARVFGGAIYLTYGFLQNLARELFVTTASADYLGNLHGLKHGKVYRQALAAAGNILCTGINGTEISSGTLWASATGTQYGSAADAYIVSGSAAVAVTAQSTGAAGNLDEGEILTLVSPIGGIDPQAAIMAGGLYGGEDTESTEGLRGRILQKIQNPGMGGQEADYKSWAMDTPSLGVTRVWVKPQYLGPGTVGVFFVCDGQDPIFPGEATIAAVQAILDAHRSIGVRQAIAYAPAQRELKIYITLSPNTAAVKQAVTDNLLLFIRNNVDVAGMIYVSQLDEQISLAIGEVDHEITELKIDDVSVGTNNIGLGMNELATLEETDIIFA